jgi:hypothetical protein
MWRARVLETPFGLLIRFITTSLVVTTINFYNVLWPSDVASLSGPFDPFFDLSPALVWSGLVSYLQQYGRLEDIFLKGFVSRVT